MPPSHPAKSSDATPFQVSGQSPAAGPEYPSRSALCSGDIALIQWLRALAAHDSAVAGHALGPVLKKINLWTEQI